MENDNTIPFGTPPVGFIQTGNQQFETPQHVSGNPFDEPSPTISTPEMSTPVSDSFTELFQQPAPVQNQQKYKIIDLFWLINSKFYAKQQPVQSEAHFVIISFNIDFGNLRISFFNLTNNSIQGNIVYLENLKRLVSGTIYPATAFNTYNSQRLAITCLEQLFRQIPGAQWQQERPVCTIEKNEEKIRFIVKDPKYGSYFYDFTGWQRDAFLHACKFTFTKGFELLAQQHLQ